MNTNDILFISSTLMKQAQENYAASLRKDDSHGMLREAGMLYRGYAKTGNSILANKWTEEYIRCWLNQDRNPPADDEPELLPTSPPMLAVNV